MAEIKTEDENNDTNGVSNDQSKVPSWLVAEVFDVLLCKRIIGYKKIKNFKALPAMSAGENYATMVLRIEVEVELNDSRTKTLSYIMKIPLDNPMMKEMMKTHNVFTIENAVYLDIVPEMEQMYRDAGIEVRFGADYYKLNTESDIEYILLEDLSSRGFKNANRLEGLDIEHIKSVLKKLAQWHAASATRVATKGAYAETLIHGLFEMAPMMKIVFDSFLEPFKQSLKSYNGNEIYGESAIQIQTNMVDSILPLGKVDPNEFNVLNHGDCWSNNIMFQYDAFGKIKETFFIDFQLPKYGSPAQDLFYFLVSSAKLEIKVKEFDFFIKYYHDHLIENLRLLKYPKKLPALKDIHIMLYKYGLWGYTTATGVMSMALLDPSEIASIDGFLSDDDAGNQLKILMYSNPRYRKHIECLLPWLHNRGALVV